LHIGDFTMPGYSALYTLILNLAIATALTPVFRSLAKTARIDETVPADYHA
jgi:hypothetical protein